MADDANPFAKFAVAPADDNPFAKFAPKKEGEVGVMEDVAKALPTGLAQGAIAIPGMAGDLSQLAKAGVDKITGKTGSPDPLGYVTGKLDENFPGAMKFFRDSNAKSADVPAMHVGSGDLPGSYKMPSSADIQGGVEKVTGPFYQAQTPTGKAVQTAAQVAPMLATGGEGLLPTAIKAAGSGIVSEGAGEAADALKGHLPGALQPYAEPVARAAGAVAGGFTPAATRRAVTPLPMTNERLQMVNALRGINPELVDASTAGQLTDSPRIANLEGRAPSMAGLPGRQEAAYTQGVMRQAGAPGEMFDTPGLAVAKSRGGELDALQNANTMSLPEFRNLNRGVDQDRRGLFREVGQSPSFDAVRDAIKNGPSGGKPPPLNMTGERYGALKQIVQNAGEAAPTTHEQTAIFNARKRLNDAFHNSLTPADAEKLKDLDKGYSNYKTIENIPAKADTNTVTPNQVFSKAQRGSDLETHATQSAQLMQPLPPRNAEISDTSHILGLLTGAALGGASHAGQGLSGIAYGAAEGSLPGLFGLPHAINVAKDVAGRTVANPTVQQYLKNQFWRPGANSSADPAVIARILMTPPVAAVTDQTK